MNTATVAEKKDVDKNLKVVLTGLAKKCIEFLLQTRPDQVFKVLRNTVPVLRIKRDNTVLVTRFDDVLEILTSRFLSGQDRVQADLVDQGNVESLLPQKKLPLLAETTAALVAEAIEGQREQQEIELVGTISRSVPARILERFFGIPALDTDSLYRWSRSIQTNILLTPGGDSREQEQVQENYAKTCAEIGEYSNRLVNAHLQDTANFVIADETLSRFIPTKTSESIEEEDRKLIANIVINLIGSLELSNIATVNVLSEIFSRPDIYQQAIEAANDEDSPLLYRLCCEALRLNPVNPYVSRIATTDYKIAARKLHGRTIPANSLIIASTRSAMHDERQVPAADAFCIDRPADQFLLVGFGFYEGLADRVVKQQVVEIVKGLLKLPGLKPISQVNYHHGFNPNDKSPFPESYYLTFERNY